MRFTDVHVGDRVLWNQSRTSSTDFTVADSYEATVTAVGVHYQFWAKGGFSGGGGRRETDLGIKVRLDGNVDETTTVAAHLIEPTEENLAKVRAYRERAAAYSAEKKRRSEWEDRTEDEWGLAGFKVRASFLRMDNGDVLLRMEESEAERLLAVVREAHGS